MKPKKIWSNLGVNDLDRTTKFYNAESKDQVDKVEKAGGKIISNPEEFGNGNYGFVLWTSN